mgnify:CR=1 FL=1
MMQIPISETVSLSSLGLDENWLQEQIWDNPSCLALGDLVGVTKERNVSSGGKLDILLKNPVDDAMYEVEVMRGETDANHIIRTIEYWDLIKKRWPQRQHFAVIIAERITKRFFNVIQILSGSVPLIAIQVNVIKSPEGHLLHFTKILDVYEEAEDDSSQDSEGYDESYWMNKSAETLSAAKKILEVTLSEYDNARLNFCKYSINIVQDGNNQMQIRARAGSNVLIEFRFGSHLEEVIELLEAQSIQYRNNPKMMVFSISNKRVFEDDVLFREIARLNNRWWQDKSSEE